MKFTWRGRSYSATCAEMIRRLRSGEAGRINRHTSDESIARLIMDKLDSGKVCIRCGRRSWVHTLMVDCATYEGVLVNGKIEPKYVFHERHHWTRLYTSDISWRTVYLEKGVLGRRLCYPEHLANMIGGTCSTCETRLPAGYLRYCGTPWSLHGRIAIAHCRACARSFWTFAGKYHEVGYLNKDVNEAQFQAAYDGWLAWRLLKSAKAKDREARKLLANLQSA